MALTKCRECGKEVSTEAKACPHCGASKPAPSQASPWVGAVVLAAIIAGVWSAFSSSGKPPPAPVQPIPQRPAVTLQENPTIEGELRHNSPALYRKLGIYKVMHAGHLQNIAGGEQAWCVGTSVGNEKAGCYVEFYVTTAAHDSPGLWEKNNLCGAMVRMYATWASPSDYKPDSGMARWMASGDLPAAMQLVDSNWRNCKSPV